MNQEKIGKLIAELRKEKNLTQEELGRKLGVTKNTVSKWERGLSLMDMSLLKPLSVVLDISIVELLNGEKISKEKLNEKTEEVVENTIDYSRKEIKKNKYINIALTTLIIIIVLTLSFFTYKLILLERYTFKEPENVKEVVEGLKIKNELKEKYSIEIDNIEDVSIVPYIYNMEEIMNIVDLVVSRSGAMTITEIANVGVPAIFIPFPFATENHQEYNAKVLENIGAAKIILDKNLTSNELNSTITNLVENKNALKDMGKKANQVAIQNVEEKIYKEIKEL